MPQLASHSADRWPSTGSVRLDADGQTNSAYLLGTKLTGTIAELRALKPSTTADSTRTLPQPPIGVNIESSHRKFIDLWTNELDAMRRHGCLFMLTNHPFLSGRPGRVETLRKLVEHALECGM